MDRLVLIVFGIAIFFAGITYLLGRVLTQIKSVKYLPALLCLFSGLYYLYLAKTVHSGAGFEDLANVIMSMMFLIGFVSGAVTGLILDIAPKFNKRS